MSGIPLPALAVHPPQQQDMGEQVGRLIQMKSLMNQQQAQQQEMQLRQQQINDQQATTAAMKQWDGKDYDALAHSVLQNGGSANAATAIQQHGLQIKKTVSDIAKQDADTGSTNLATFSKKHEMIGDALKGLEAIPDDQIHQATIEKIGELSQGGVFDQQTAQGLVQKVQQVPDAQTLRGLLDQTAKASLGAKYVADQAKTQAETEKDTQQGKASQAEAAKTQLETDLMRQWGTPQQQEAKYTSLLSRQNQGVPLTKQEQAFKKAYEQTKTLVPRTTINLQSGLLSDQAKQMAANLYQETGQLPAGMRSPAMSAGILNQAAGGPSGVPNIAANKATYQANEGSLKSMQKQFDNVTAFENTAGKNLDTFLGTAKKIIDSGSPWINTPLRKVSGQGFGSEDMAAFNAARTTAVTEIAKVLSSANAGSGVLSDSARHEVEGLIGPDASLKQIVSAANILKQDMGNRHQAYAQQLGDIKGRMGGQQTTEQSAPAAAPPSGKSVSLAAARQLPINKGKSDDEIRKDIESHGHKVID